MFQAEQRAYSCNHDRKICRALVEHAEYETYSLKSITTLLSCQIFLTHNFGFQTEAPAGNLDGAKDSNK
eukprot:scaffold168397_cov24-Prasinocladus_malaysianus.AAC.1